MIAIIVAKASNNVIGNKNDLPWYLPADLKHFKEVTTGHTVVMGRITFESIYKRLNSALPNRRNIVLSASLNSLPSGFELASSLDQAIELAGNQNTTFIIGGATIYKECLDIDLVDTIYLTEVKKHIEGDTYFPKLDDKLWRKLSQETHIKDEKNPYDYDFIVLERDHSYDGR